MPTNTVWMLAGSNITVSGGSSLSGMTQGDGSHLVGRTITLNSKSWQPTQITDNDAFFDDNDTGQKLTGAQTIGGVSYANGTVVEAEYRLTLRDPATGATYRVYGYNINNSTPAYATVEGLAFFGGEGGFPPVAVALRVQSAAEGPGSSGQQAVGFNQLAYPPCLTPGTLIRTPGGERRIETLRAGDRVMTRDAGAQPIIWAGQVIVGPARLRACPAFRPIRIAAGALGPGLPRRDLLVSPQHRMLVGGWRAELMFGCAEVLVAARHLVDGATVQVAHDVAAVTYIHLALADHQVIWAEGAETESFHTAAADALAPGQKAELFALFPRLANTPPSRSTTARPCLRRWEALALAC